LREVSNFLTPKVGPVSTDTWSTAVLSIRNILLNWTVFVPLLMLVALAPGLSARLADAMGGRTGGASCLFLYILILFGLGVLLVGEFFACSYLPSHRIGGTRPGEPARRTLMEPSSTILTKATAHVNVIVFGCLWAATLTFIAAALSEGAGEVTAQRLVSALPGAGWFDRFMKDEILEAYQARLVLAVLVGVGAWCASLAAFVLATWDARKDDLEAWHLSVQKHAPELRKR
jgi:hypothetical protein